MFVLIQSKSFGRNFYPAKTLCYTVQWISFALRNCVAFALRTGYTYACFNACVNVSCNIAAYLKMSMTAEPGRRRSNDKDLRWRTVYQRVGTNLAYSKIASNLNISTASVYTKLELTGHVDPVTADRRDTDSR